MLTVENLEKELKEGKLNSIYLLYGERVIPFRNLLKKNKKQLWRNGSME